jgi:hypothetical protein
MTPRRLAAQRARGSTAHDRLQRSGWRRDDGSVLPLVIGVVVVVLSLITVVTDASVLFLQRRCVQAAVDGAALAGAQAVDLGRVYAGGARGDLVLDPRAARAAVTGYVRALPARPAGLRVTSVRVVTATVTVRAQAVVRPPFLAFLTGRGVTVVAEASARTTTG